MFPDLEKALKLLSPLLGTDVNIGDYFRSVRPGGPLDEDALTFHCSACGETYSRALRFVQNETRSFNELPCELCGAAKLELTNIAQVDDNSLA